MTVLAACTLLWYIPVIVVTTIVHVFVTLWRQLGMRSYILLYGTGLIIFLCVLLLIRYLLMPKLTMPTYLTAIGIVLLTLGLSFLVWSYKTLKLKALSWVLELSSHEGQASQHVQAGPYRLCRHPVYSAAFAIMVGVLLSSGFLCLAIPIAMLAVLIGFEERELRRRFGDSYIEYARRTPILLWPKPRHAATRNVT